MKPTNKLRFIERHCYVKNGEPFTQKQQLLQQWWERFDFNAMEFKGEWRDVPLEAV